MTVNPRISISISIDPKVLLESIFEISGAGLVLVCYRGVLYAVMLVLSSSIMKGALKGFEDFFLRTAHVKL